MNAEIRKHQHTLFIAGYAAIMFGIWDIVKTLLNLTINDSLFELIEKQTLDYPFKLKIILAIFTGVILIIVLLISISLRLVVGRTAIRLGMGEDRKCGGMVFCSVILLLTNLAGSAVSIIGAVSGEDIINMAGSFLVDLTSFFMMLCILTSIYKLKKLTRQSAG